MAVNRPTLESGRALDQLRAALRNLAAPGRDALDAMPAGSVRPDELALEFDDVMEAGLAYPGLSEKQRRAVRHVDDLLSAMSGAANDRIWTEKAVLEDPRWVEIRRSASRALELLNRGIRDPDG